MFKKITYIVAFVVFLTNVNCAIRKSWQSSKVFDAESANKIKPFGENVEESRNAESDGISMVKTTFSSTSPSPSAETLVNKISSKFKMPEKYIHEIQKKNDFGSFDNYKTINSPNAIHNDETKENISAPEEYIDDLEIAIEENDEKKSEYKIEQLVKINVDSENSTLNLNLDRDTLKDIFTGRGKKYGMLERVVPLFIIPFLIQSAIVPFIVTTIKLFLMKSLFAGKIAIIFLLLGALKNHQNNIYMKSFTGQSSPYLVKDYSSPYLPERRIETGFDGYKVDGKTESFVH